MNKQLKVISKPNPDSVTLLLPKKGETLPLIKFDGDLDLLCGNCNEILVEGIIEEDQIKNVVIRCPTCRSYNEVNMSLHKSANMKETVRNKVDSNLV
ncbi:hypothetical protein JJE00_04165 [Candidatus Bathyarchaeota archaeon]|nr:hypothetical protein [Candidatus Bathyarchaeota archaeon]